MARRKPTNRLPSPVEHPRYGSKPIDSGTSVSAEELRHSYWRYAYSAVVNRDGTLDGKRTGTAAGTDFVFLQSAVAANTGKQRYGVFPRLYYVDTLRKCVACEEWFIFFAREQQYWYEVLGFWIDSDCVHCHGCRKHDQRLRRAQRRYAERSVIAPSLTDREFSTLLKDALFLTQSGIMKVHQKLRRLRNIAEKRGLSGDSLAAVSRFLGNGPAPSGAEC